MKQDTIKNTKRDFMIDKDDLKTVFSYLKNKVFELGFNSFKKGIYMYINYSEPEDKSVFLADYLLLGVLRSNDLCFRFEFDEETENYFIVINLVYALPKLYWIFL